MHWLKLSLPTSQRSSRSSERRGATPRTRRTFSLETLEAKRVLDGTGLLEPPTDDALPLAAAPNTPPATPVVTEPTAAEEGSYEALRIQVNPYFDADGDAHLSTDWEIWTASPLELVWTSYGKTGIDRTHTDLADGVYAGSHAGRTSLFPDTAYVLRVRFHDAQGTVSEWGVQNFQTGSASSIFPLEVRDILAAPAPAWTATVGGAVSLPAGTTPPALEVSTEAGALLLRVQGSASGNVTTNPEILPDFGAVRVRIAAGSAPLALTESDLVFADENGQTITISLPAVSLAAGESLDLWVGLDGSTYYGAAAQTTPEFSLLARGAAVPYVVMQPGYKVEVVAAGFQLPVNIVFVPNPGDLPSDPFYYVIELYGNIKVVSRDGTVSDYVTGLLNFNPTGNFPGSGEQGVAGLVVEPTTGDLIISLLYSTNPADDSAPHYPKLVRLHSADGGRTAATQTTIITFPGETQGQAHQIANLTIDPNDGKLYVHMGDGFDIATALNLDSYRGKILRMNLDGSPATDNPLYDAADGINSRDYIYAYGMRNPFGGAWRASDGQHYFVENGPNLDRFAKLVAGRNYTFDGSDESMYAHAIYNWVPAHAPVNMAFIQPETFGGSLFPASKYDHAFVAESGPTWGLGPQSLGKRIAEFTLDAAGNLVGSPTTLVEYNGSGRGSVVGLAAGPDGLYFSTMYQDQNYQSPIDRGAQILRIKYVGIGNFTSNVQLGTPGVPVKFTDASDVPNATGWLWDFGDGTTSTLQNPTHVYTALGEYSVRLQVTGPNGVATVEKPDFIRVLPNSAGLQAEYFDNMDLTDLKLVRTDAQINYDWGLTAPIPGMGVDTFSVRWSGYILPQFSETYTFHATADDGVRLWVNDQLIIDKWIDQGATEHVGSIALVAGQKSSIKLEYYDNGANAVAQLGWSSPSLAKQIIPASAFSQTNAPPPPTTGTGLNVEYFDNSDLTNSKVARVESQINNDWGLGSPHPAIDVDTFSARWTGYIQAPSTETYTFFTQSDDGVRLWIDDVLIVDNWTNHALTENSGTISLIAGQRYSIRMEYYDNGAFATARLLWQTPAQAKELVPASAFFAALTDVPPPLESGLHAEYFDNADLTNLKVTRVDSVINNNWNAGSPDPSIEPDSFSARWTGFIQAPTTERYTFYTQSDDGIRLWVNGQLLIDNWTNHSALVNRATFDFVAGQRYSFKLEHYDSAGMATAKLAWSSDTQVKQIVPASAFYLEGDGTDPEPPPPPPATNSNGLTAEYFDNMDLTAPVLTRTENQINYDWGLGSPDSSVGPDTFSVRWTGFVQPAFSETYAFHTRSDDGVRLWINDQLIIDKWNDQASAEHSGAIGLVAGQKYALRMEYFDNASNAEARLLWSSPSQTKGVIPASALFTSEIETPSDAGLLAQYFDNADLTNLALTRTDAQINNNWDLGSPDPSIAADTFSIRWTGQITPATSGAYTFYTQTDDGVRLWVNGQLLVDQWSEQAGDENSGSIALVAGQKYDLRMEYFENGAHAEARLSWSAAGLPKQIVPASAFTQPTSVPNLPDSGSYKLADINFDGLVDGADYTAWADHLGQFSGDNRILPGDFNWDGVVDAADYTLWADNSEVGSPAATSVPSSAAAAVGAESDESATLVIGDGLTVDVPVAALRTSLRTRIDAVTEQVFGRQSDLAGPLAELRALAGWLGKRSATDLATEKAVSSEAGFAVDELAGSSAWLRRRGRSR